MPVLCLDTAGSRVVLALAGADGELLAGTVVDGRAQTLLAHLEPLLADAGGLARADIERIVVGIGPGGFTGLRVGVAMARGLAEALGVPLHAVGSLEAQAADTAYAAPGTTVWAALDARRGEHFAQPWQVTPAGELVALAPPVAIPSAAVGELEGTVLADGWPTPGSLARAASGVVARDAAGGDPLLVLPDYVRAPDAEPPKPRLRIDALRTTDIDALLGLEARCFSEPWNRRMYEEELARPAADAVLLAARDLAGGARLVGAVLAARIGDSWHVMNVMVDPPARRRGIAARLVDEVLAQTEALGVRDGWTLEVRDGNEAAIGLYESRGFVNQGRRRGYYAETGEDALVMWRTFPAPNPPA